MRHPAPALLVLLALAACSQTVTTAADIKGMLTRSQLNSSSEPILLVDLPSQGTAATMQVIGRNDGVVTWRTADDTHISFREGLLVATRGLGFDLMSADVSEPLHALRSGPPAGAYYERFHSYLDGNNEVVFRAFECRQTERRPDRITIVGASHSVVRITEQCVSPGLETTNRYWVGGDGAMWRSRQWISQEAGYVTTERLVE